MESKHKEEGNSNIKIEDYKIKTEDFKIKGDWNKQASYLKEQYPKLTNEDVKFETGKETDLYKRLETRLGKNRNEVIGIIITNQNKV